MFNWARFYNILYYSMHQFTLLPKSKLTIVWETHPLLQDFWSSLHQKWKFGDAMSFAPTLQPTVKNPI